jgi:uncharacterized protein
MAAEGASPIIPPEAVDASALRECVPEDVSVEPRPGQPCRRCRKQVAAGAAVCPSCGARQPGEDGSARSPSKQAEDHSGDWSRLIVGYAVSLVVFVMSALVLRNASAVEEESTQLAALFVIDLVYSSVVLWCWLGLRPRRSPDRPQVPQWIVWPVSGAAMAVMLLVNRAYHEAMQSMGLEIIDLVPDGTQLWWWWMLTICVQPAVVEEMFFRSCTWKAMSPALGRHGVVIVSSVMFGMAHIGVPLSIPIITLLGVVLGYARAYSGGVVLPMLLHFVHNLVVISW